MLVEWLNRKIYWSFGQSIYDFDPEWNITTTAGWTAVIFMGPEDEADSLWWSDRHLWFWVNFWTAIILISLIVGTYIHAPLRMDHNIFAYFFPFHLVKSSGQKFTLLYFAFYSLHIDMLALSMHIFCKYCKYLHSDSFHCENTCMLTLAFSSKLCSGCLTKQLEWLSLVQQVGHTGCLCIAVDFHQLEH